MKKALGTFLLAVGVAGFALAGTPAVPEVDPSSFASVLALISGTLLVVRGRWRN